MKIAVKAKTRAREDRVERLTQPSFDFGEPKPELIIYKVSVKEAPVEGRANEAIIKILGEYFDVPQSCIRLVSGHSSKRKIFIIEE